MRGMNRLTGATLSGEDHLAQSIGDILSTPVGSRVGRRDYGSLLPRLLDQPYNAALRLRLFAATALALVKWEPRITLSRVGLVRNDDGTFLLSIEGRRTDTSTPTSLTRLSVPLAGAIA